jgi:hypothetical protein
VKAPWLFFSALGSLLIASCGAQSDAPSSTVEANEDIGRTAAERPVVQSAHELPATVVAPTRPRPRRAGGLLAGMVPFRGGPERTSATPQCKNPKVAYFGGPILQDPVIVAVFWSTAVNTQVQQNIGQFFTDVTQSTYWTWLQEYDTVGLAGGSEQAILPGTYGGGFVIAPTKCNPGGNKCKLTDTDLQTELTRQIGLGILPAPTLDCTGNANTVYMIELPSNVSLTGPDGSGTSCVDYCAYHNTGTYGTAKTPLIYGALMDVFTGGCAEGCGGNPTPLENATSLASHELVEAVTDPDIGLDTQDEYAAPAGWGDNNNNCGEVADICDSGGVDDTITVGGRTWSVQEIWSNKQGKCVSTGPAVPICSGTTTTGCRLCSCGDDGLGCNGATPVCETTSTNVLFGACEACTATSGNCSAGATCQQSKTPSQDDICVGATCVPKTACPAGDNCGTVSDGCSGTIDCGTCTAPQTCGGGTPSNPNVCGSGGTCVPATTCPAGDNCGTVSNGCGGTITCGTCTAPETCGGGTPSNPNVCGSGGACVPATSCPAGLNCGNYFDGCTGIINCGTCTAPQTCGGGSPSNPNICGGGSTCVPATACAAGDDCGVAANGCGGTISCGTCTAPQTCGGGSPSNPNQCGCTAATACPAGDTCGTVPDGCGGTVACGTCSSSQVCSGNQCVAAGTTTSTSSSSASSSGTATTSSSSSSGASTTTGSGTGGSGAGGSTGTSATGGSTGSATGGSASSSSATTGAGTGGTTSFTTGTGGSGGTPVTSGEGGNNVGTGGSASGSPGQSGGCGCKTAGEPVDTNTSSLSAFGALVIAGAMRTRRRRAKASVASR